MLQVNDAFAFNLLTTYYHEQVLELLQHPTYPVLAMVKLQQFTCNSSFVMAISI